jgi:hypothetical protein
MSFHSYPDITVDTPKHEMHLLRKKKPTEVLKNIFNYRLAPSDDLSKTKLSDYYTVLSYTPEEYYNVTSADLEDWMKDNVVNKPRTELPFVDTVYCVIDYPVENTAIIKFKTHDVTYGKLLYLNTIAYQLMYATEDEDVGHATENIKGMYNRAPSKGRFGIYGHHITDLVYNGGSKITIYDNVAVCVFSVDS